MKTIASSFVAVALLALAGPALAAQNGSQGGDMTMKPKAAMEKKAEKKAPGGKSFASLDKDKDSQLSREEFLAAGAPSPHERFMSCDADSSFSLSPEEYDACMKK